MYVKMKDGSQLDSSIFTYDNTTNILTMLSQKYVGSQTSYIVEFFFVFKNVAPVYMLTEYDHTENVTVNFTIVVCISTIPDVIYIMPNDQLLKCGYNSK